MVKYYLTGKIRKKERIEKKKGWFDKEIIEIPVYEAEKTNKWDTLYDERDSLEKLLKENGINVDKKALERVLIHTHTGLFLIKGDGEAYSPSREEAIKYSILFQLLGIPVAHENWIYKASEIYRTTEKILDVAIRDEKVEEKWVWHPEFRKVKDNAQVLPPFDELKKEAPTIALILRKEFYHIPEKKRRNMEQFVNAAIALAEKLAEIKARGDRATDHIRAGNVKEFEEFIAALKQIAPEEMLEGEKQIPEKKAVEKRVTAEARELLGMLKGLRYTAYSEEAVKRALGELEAKVKGLLSNPGENLELLGLYLTLERFLKDGDFERAEKFLEALAR